MVPDAKDFWTAQLVDRAHGVGIYDIYNTSVISL